MKNEIQTIKRIEWIDTAKGIGILLVILGHLHVSYMATWIYTFHMPLFFFLSGVVFSGEKYIFRDFCIKRIKSLVIPYFFLGLVIYLFYVIVNMVVDPGNGPYGSNLEMLKNLFIQEHFWTVWFLTCLFVVEILYYYIWKIFSRWNWGPTIVSICIGIFGLLRYQFGYSSLPWNIDIALVAQLFFHVGHIFRKRKEFREKMLNAFGIKFQLLTLMFFLINIVASVLGMKIAGESLDMSVGLYGNECLTLISAFAGIMFVIIGANKIKNPFFTYLGQNTMILFAWHSRIVIVLCEYIYEYVGVFQGEGFIEQLVYAVVTFIIILLILIPVNEWIKKQKFHALFGV